MLSWCVLAGVGAELFWEGITEPLHLELQMEIWVQLDIETETPLQGVFPQKNFATYSLKKFSKSKNE